MAIGKRGVFFTFTALLILTVVFMDALYTTRVSYTDQTKATSVRTSTLTTFQSGFEEDVQRGLFIAGFRALLAAEQHVAQQQEFLPNAQDALREAVMNGSINGSTLTTMDESTIKEWLSRLQTEANEVGILVNFTVEVLTINHTTPWEIQYLANVSYNITDVRNTARFTITDEISANVGIIGLRDPLYTIHTHGGVLRTINQTPYEGNYVNGLDTSNLIAHIENKYYTNGTGPSYLMRLEGNTSSSPYGIESFVQLPELEDAGLPVYERSAIDYLYLVGDTSPAFTINNTYEGWLRIDTDHLEKYQVEDRVI